MMRGNLPAPSFDPIAMLIVAIDLPFIAAAGLEVALGRPAPSLPEMALVAMFIAASAVWAVWRVVVLVRLRYRRR
jgi:hypothetical protein